jgi:hypothetical protein
MSANPCGILQIRQCESRLPVKRRLERTTTVQQELEASACEVHPRHAQRCYTDDFFFRVDEKKMNRDA